MIKKNSLLVILCCFLATTLNAQWFLTYGLISYRKDFQGQLNKWDATKIGNPIQVVGFHVNGPVYQSTGSGERRTYMDLQFNKYLPQRIVLNDSVTGVISGSSFAYSEAYDFFKKSDHFDLALGGGFNFGRLKLNEQAWSFFDVRSNQLHLKNMLICPKAILQLRVMTKGISFMATAEFQYDVSNSDWKEKLWSRRKPDSYPVSGFNQTGFCCFIGIGYNLHGNTNVENDSDDIEEDINY